MTAVFLLAGYPDPPGLLARMNASGVRRVVLLSTGAVVNGNLDNYVVRFNVVSEAAVRDSGLAWAVLRPSGFMSNALRWLAAPIMTKAVARSVCRAGPELPGEALRCGQRQLRLPASEPPSPTPTAALTDKGHRLASFPSLGHDEPAGAGKRGFPRRERKTP